MLIELEYKIFSYSLGFQLPAEDLLDRRKGLRIDVEDGELYIKRNYEADQRLRSEPVETIAKPSTERHASGMEEDEEGGAEGDDDENEDNEQTAAKGDAEGEDANDEEMMEEGAEADKFTKQDHPDFPKIDAKTKERLLIRFEDLDESMVRDREHYTGKVKELLEKFIGEIKSTNVIELDGNLCPTEMLYVC